jgi:hypothetical protein
VGKWKRKIRKTAEKETVIPAGNKKQISSERERAREWTGRKEKRATWERSKNKEI